MDRPKLPPASMLTMVVALALAEFETEVPGFLDRVIGRLSSEALRAQVISIRGERALPTVLQAQEEALTWLTAIAPMVRGAGTVRRKRGR